MFRPNTKAMNHHKTQTASECATSCSSVYSIEEVSASSPSPSNTSSKTSLAFSETKSPEPYVPLTDNEIESLARKAAERLGGKLNPHAPSMLPDEETIFLSYHPSHDISTVTRAMIRDDLSKFEQRICPHRCTSDAAFYKSVRRHCGFRFVVKRSRAFFGGENEGISKTWCCARKRCTASAWIEMGSDTKMLTIEIRR